jgi:amidase
MGITFYPVWNLLGYPVAALPAGFDEVGLPIGVQLGGPAGSERRLLSLAGQYERAHPWASRRPPI